MTFVPGSSRRITADLRTLEPVPGNVKKGDGPPDQQRGKEGKAEQKPWEITTLRGQNGAGKTGLGKEKEGRAHVASS